MFGHNAALIAVCATTLIAGCSPYVEDFRYVPHPAITEIRPATSQPAQQGQASQQGPPVVEAYATIVGIRREDRQRGIPLSVEVRLQLDNLSSQQISFDPGSLALTNSELVRFPPPIVSTDRVISVMPEQPATVEAHFPFPPGLSYNNMDLQTLQLRWAVQIDGRSVPEVVNFRRAYRYYYDPYWDSPPYAYPYPYPYSYGPRFGVGVIIRR
jgi:hypothetical protein